MRAIAAAALLLAACGDDGPLLERFEIRFALDEQCAFASCGDYALTCGAMVSVRLLDSIMLNDEEPTVRAQSCVRVSELPSQTLCDAGEVSIDFADVPRQPGMIEVVIWPDPQPGETDCPEVRFTVQGRPREDQQFEREPAFARRQLFDFSGPDEIARVELDCWQPELLAQSDCAPDGTFVSAFVTNLATLLSINQAQAQQLSVTVGQPSEVVSGGFEIVPGQTFRLVLVGAEPFAPQFEATTERTFTEGSDVCVLVLADVFSPETVSCHPAEPTSGTSDRDVLELQGLMVASDDLELILTAIGLDEPPPEGMVVGRVVEAVSPMAGVTVTPLVAETPPQIYYLNEDLTSAEGLIATSSSGYFVALGVPFGTEWEATRPGGWHTELAPKPAAGNIVGRITAVILRMSQD